MGSCLSSGIRINDTNTLDNLNKYKENTIKSLEIEYEVCQLEKIEESLNEKIDSNIEFAAGYIERNLVEMAKNKIKENILYKRQLDIIGVNRLSLIRMKNNMLLENMNGKIHDLIKSDCGKDHEYNKTELVKELEINEKQQEQNDDIATIINSRNEFNEKEIDRDLGSIVDVLNKNNKNK